MNAKEKALISGLNLLNEMGAPNVSTNSIAIEADISVGNLYYHFKNKQQIVLALFERFLKNAQKHH